MKLQHRRVTVDEIGNNPLPTVTMTISSELPVLTKCKIGGSVEECYEILDHSPESVDLSRAADGLVVLDDHGGDQIGLMGVKVLDRKLSGTVTFGAGDRASIIAIDAANGIRRNVSIGYFVDSSSYIDEGTLEGVRVVRAMRWTPYEASFVSIPADHTVGVNRSANVDICETEKKENKMEGEKIEEVVEEVKPEVSLEDEIFALIEMAARYGIPAIEVKGKTKEEVDQMVLAKQAEELEASRKKIQELETRNEKERMKMKSTEQEIGGVANVVVKQERKYNLMNVVRSMSGMKADIGFEREISDELAKERGKAASGIIIPHGVLAKRDFTVSGTSSASVATDLMSGDFIDLLRSKSILGEAGVRFMTGLQGNVAIPKMTAGATGYWVAESGDITESQPTLGQVTGSPHTCGVMTDISRRLIIQSNPSAEMLVRDEIMERIVRTIQIAVFAGTGADGQPAAITNASGINNPSVTTGTPTYAELLGFPGAIMADNAETSNQKWVMTAEVWQKLAATFTDGTAKAEHVLDWKSKTCLGFPYLVTEDVPANSLWFGDFSNIVVGVWGNGLDLTVDTSTLSSSGGIRLVGLQDVDVMVRLGQALAYNTAVTS